MLRCSHVRNVLQWQRSSLGNPPFSSATRPLGFRYLSRRHKIHNVLVVISQSLVFWRNGACPVVSFSEVPHSEFARAYPDYVAPLRAETSVLSHK